MGKPSGQEGEGGRGAAKRGKGSHVWSVTAFYVQIPGNSCTLSSLWDRRKSEGVACTFRGR